MTIDIILDKCINQKTITNEEIKFLLECQDKDEVEKVFAAARKAREINFGNKIYMYGFVYFSTFCKNECTFCYFRASNSKPPRYRKTHEEIVRTAVELKNSGVHLIDLTMGEDIYFTGQKLKVLIQDVKSATGLPVMVSPGVVNKEEIEQLAIAGADWYALYQETHNRELFQRMRLNQSYDDRLNAKKYAAECGMLIEEGLLTGIGDSVDDAIHSFQIMKELKAMQLRTMTFVPQEGTPLEGLPQHGHDRELRYIAVIRLLFPQMLIPASLDVDGLNGLEARLNAGGNVVTSIIPPKKGYTGVAHAEYDIDEGYRTVEGIQDTLKKCGLFAAAPEEYIVKLEQFKKNLKLN